MSIKNKINIAVIGATGYTGLDLIFLLSKHPKVIIKNLCATKKLGKKISFFDKRITKKLPSISSINKINWKSLDLVFLSLPNGEAQKLIKKTFFKNKNIKFIDLSADFRITNLKTYKEYYNIKHKASGLLKHSLYLLFFVILHLVYYLIIFYIFYLIYGYRKSIFKLYKKVSKYLYS